MSRHHQMRVKQRKRWQYTRRRALNRDGWRCRKCGRPGRLEVHHIVPLHQGGAGYDLSNLETLCRGCHIAITAADNRREPSPGEDAWHELVAEAVAATR